VSSSLSHRTNAQLRDRLGASRRSPSSIQFVGVPVISSLVDSSRDYRPGLSSFLPLPPCRVPLPDSPLASQIALRLDTAQNEIIIWDSLLGVALCSVLLATFIPSMAGMNVKFSFDTGATVFGGSLLFSLGLGFVFLLLSLISLRRTGVL
jgi:hypothetical protein